MDGAYCANFWEKAAAALDAFASSAKILAEEVRLLAPASRMPAETADRSIFDSEGTVLECPVSLEEPSSSLVRVLAVSLIPFPEEAPRTRSRDGAARLRRGRLQ